MLDLFLKSRIKKKSYSDPTQLSHKTEEAGLRLSQILPVGPVPFATVTSARSV